MGCGLNKARRVLPIAAAFADVANATVTGDASAKSCGKRSATDWAAESSGLRETDPFQPPIT
jgi:hypothetical protein